LTNVKIKSIPIPILDIYKKIYNIISIWASLEYSIFSKKQSIN
jgi:hypothetical protein